MTKESEIELPKIFKQAQDKNSKLYTEEEFTLENCTLNETKDKVIINDGVEEATVTINGGELSREDDHTKSKLYIKVDKIPPVLRITYDNTNLTNKPVTATITANEEIQEVEGWTLGEDKKTLTKEYTQNINETVTVKDIAGNEAQIDVKISNIDLEAPKLEIKYNTTNPTKENVIATIESDEEIQEVEGWTLGEDRRTLTKEYGENIEETVTVKDIAGNETKISVNIGNIDREKPKVEVSYSTKEETQGPVTVTIKANEEIEEVEGWELSKDRKTLTKEYSENTNEEITVRDLAGNEEKAVVSIGNINIRELKLNIKYSTTKKTNENVIVTIEANEEIKEVKGWQLGENRKTLTKTYTENTKETVEIEDMLGYKTKKEIEITNIDRIKPKVSVKYSTTAMTNKNIIVTLTADEEIQVTEGWQLGKDGKTLTKTYAKNIEEEVIVKDIAGNEEKVRVQIRNIDLKAPEVQISYSTTTKTNTPVTVTIKTDEEIEEVEGWELSEDRKTLTKVYSANGEETITITDLVGNSREVKVNVSNIVKNEQNTGNNNNNTSGIVNNGVADKELPKAGGNIILITIIGIIILIAIILKTKLKKYKDVK